MTLQEIINMADRKYPNALTTAQKVSILNEFQRQLFRTIYKKETATTWDIVTDQYLYPLHFNKGKVIDITVKGSDGYNDYDYEANADSETDSPYYYLYENSIALYPTPTANVTAGLMVLHYVEPNELLSSALTETPDFDKDFHMILVYGLLIEMAEDDQRIDMVNGFTSKYNGLLEEFKDANPEPELPPIRVG